MNNIESMKSTLEVIRNQIAVSSTQLNSALSEVGVSKEDFNNVLLKIEKQIASAENKFTIAFVGTFKTGKSTIINSLLGLKGEARLSSEYDPDTARCIRIVAKNGQKYEAEVDFGTYCEPEQLSWSEAKKYTSQVALDSECDSFRKKALMIKEVRYYVDSPLLNLCNILDLPGTGTGSHGDHTAVTDEKIMESDCFFWVLSTDMDPDIETIKNLKKIRHKLLPIINVWKFERDGIEGEFSPEEIIDSIKDGYSEYLVNADNPIVYYAKEIDYAQINGLPLKDEWGKEAFIEKVQEIISNVQSGDRATRIKTNILDALLECRGLLENVKDSSKLKELRSLSQKNKTEIMKQSQKLDRCNNLVSGDITATAKKTTDEVLDIITKASESFIQNKMSGVDLRYLLKMFTKKQKEEMSQEFAEEFKKNYLRFDSGWLEDAIEDYCNEVFKILKSKYIDFSCSLMDEAGKGNTGFDPGELTGFMDTVSSQIQKDFQAKSVKLLASAVLTGILLLIPGLNVLDSIAAICSVGSGIGGFADDSKLRSRINMIIVQSKVQIRQQKYSIVKQLKDQGEDIGKDFYSKVEAKLIVGNDRIKEDAAKLSNISKLVDSFEELLSQAEKEINGEVSL